MKRFSLLALCGLGLLLLSAASGAHAQAPRPKLGSVFVTFGFDPLATQKKDLKDKKDSKEPFKYVEAAKRIQLLSGNLLEVVQIPLFPAHLSADGLPKTRQLWKDLNAVVPEVVPILMLTEDPRLPANETKVADMLATGLIECGKLGATTCSSTSYEAWMADTQGKVPALTAEKLDRAIAQLVKVHVKAIRKAEAEGCKVKHLDMEYLRPIEFSTFTNFEVAYKVVAGINKELGKPFARILDDLAHAGDSGLSLEKINAARVRARDDKAYGIVHFSAPTTRGKLGPADVAALAQAQKHGHFSAVLVEIFDPQGPETELMRKNIKGYGKKTFDDPAQAIADGLKLAENFLKAK